MTYHKGVARWVQTGNPPYLFFGCGFFDAEVKYERSPACD